MKKLLSIIQKMNVATRWRTKRTLLFIVVLMFVGTITAQNATGIGKRLFTQEPIQDKYGLSEKMLAPIKGQLRSATATNDESTIDLGDGMSILGSTADANSTLAIMTVNNNQWTKLLDGYDFYGELQNITNTVYGKFKDDFDFVFYVLDLPEDDNVIDNLGFYGINMGVSNDIQGIGLNTYNSASYWGSASKLKSTMYFPYAGAILYGPTLHELAHNWAAYIVPTYAPDDTRYDGHWGISNAEGQLGGFKYVREVEQNSGGIQGKTKYQASFASDEKNPDGSYKYPGFGVNANGGNGLPYSDIELYLMGMKSAQDLRNGGFHLDIYSGNDYEYEGTYSFGKGYFYSTTKTSYSIDDLIGIAGARVPDASSSQKDFKILTVAISKENSSTHYYSDIINAVNWLAGPESDQTYYWLYNFKQATYGIGSLETSGINNSLKNNTEKTVTLNKTSATLEVGQTEQLTAMVSSGEAVTWSSNNNSVATVSSSGLVTAVAKGSASITATIPGGISATCTVTVTANSVSIYNPDDVAVINAIIENNGLNWTKADPADGSYIPANWRNGISWSNEVNNKRITSLSISEHSLTGTLNLSGLTNLQSLYCGKNNLTSLDVSKLTDLTTLYCFYNNLTSLNVSGSINLKILDCRSNNLASLDVSELTNLQIFACGNNNLTSLDVSKLTNLQELYCNNNNLASLDVSKLTDLNILYCNNNNLASLDISKLINLRNFWCHFNNLTSLNVSKSTHLQFLYCDNNNLTSLDVSGLINLEELWCNNNHLTVLDLTEFSRLRMFFGTDQAQSITLTGTPGNYNANVTFNANTTFDNTALSYSNGVLTSTSIAALSSGFTSPTGSAGRALTGTLKLIYPTPTEVIVNENEPAGKNGQGSIGVSLNIPTGIPFEGNFTITLPKGFSLNSNLTSLAGELSNDYILDISLSGNNKWQLNISSKSLPDSNNSTYQKIVNLVYDIDESIADGTYPVVISGLNFNFENGSTIFKETIDVNVTVDHSYTGIRAVDFVANLYYLNGNLYVDTPAEEQVSIYSISGNLLYQLQKQAGKTSISIGNIPPQVLIVKGSSGWNKKIAAH